AGAASALAAGAAPPGLSAAAARCFSERAPAATLCPTDCMPVLATLPKPAAAPLRPPPTAAEPASNADFALPAVDAIERAPPTAIRAAPGAMRAPAATAPPTPDATAPAATAVPATAKAVPAAAPAPSC